MTIRVRESTYVGHTRGEKVFAFFIFIAFLNSLGQEEYIT